MPAKLQEITATFIRERHRFTGSQGDTIIGDALMIAGEGVTRPQNVTVKGVADADGPTTDQTYRFYGFWSAYQNKFSGRKENQFHYQTFVRNAPHSRAGVVGYLEKCPGVGRTTAGRIYDKFNSSSVQILREQPDLVADQVPRFSAKKAREAAAWLVEKHKLENLTIELIELLDGRGFRKSTAKAAVERWGNRAGEKIRRNPFCLDGFPGVGFKLCDNLYLELGLPPGALKRQARYLAHHLRKATADGHTWHSADSVYAGLRAAMPGVAVDFPRAWRLAQRAGLIVSCFADNDGPAWDATQQWFALASKARNERRVAEYLAAATLEQDAQPQFKEHLRFPGYEIGTDGSVWSRWSNGGKLTSERRRLQADEIKGGYLRVRLRKSSMDYEAVQISHLVLEVFIGSRPSGCVACHGDGDPKNNSLLNLRWDTRSANEDDKHAHGTHQTGEGNPAAKLTDDKVREMRQLRAEGLSTYKLAEHFDISRPVAAKIVKGELWRHVV